MDAVNAQAFAIRYAQPAESLRLSNAAFAQAETDGNLSMQAYALLNRYFAKLILSDAETGLVDLFTASDLFDGLNDPSGQVLCSAYMANHFESIGLYEKALGHLVKVFDGMAKADEDVRSQALSTAGNIYFKMGHLDKALDLLQQTLELRRAANDRSGMAASHNQIGRLLGVMGRSPEAFDQYTESYRLRQELGETSSLAWTHLGIGSLHVANGNAEAAITELQNGLMLLAPTDVRGRMHLQLALGRAQLLVQQSALAINALEIAAASARTVNANDTLQEALAALAEAWEKQGDAAKALAFLQEHLALREAARKEELTTRIAQVERSMEAEYAVREAKVLKVKNDELDEKNRTITASINYASRIQRAILPAANELQRLLPGAFLLYRPKDIVSGDFYWASEVRGSILIVVGDCTGHGVPGAFMSMIGTDLLNHIIFEAGIDSPALILEAMHNRVRQTLKQDKEDPDSQDGMELAICRIDPKTQQLHYAGARRPLIHCALDADGNYQLMEVKPDRNAIGGQRYTEETTFTEHTIALSAGDCFYMFSDGIQDQFDAENKLKFSTRRLKETLLQLSPLSPHQQLLALEQTLNTWQGPSHQTDDVVLFGVKNLG